MLLMSVSRILQDSVQKIAGRLAVSLQPREFLIVDDFHEVHASIDENDSSRVHVLLQMKSSILTEMLHNTLLPEQIKCDLRKAAQECGVEWDRCDVEETSTKTYLTEYFLTPQ
jgi:hypothetical protein